MSMTKTDYELIAKQVTLTRSAFDQTSISSEAWEVLTGLSYQLAKALHEDNPKKFDRDRFLKACGLGES